MEPTTLQALGAGRRMRLVGATLVSMDERIGVIDDAVVGIEGEEFTFVGPAGSGTAEATADQEIDARGYIMFPGLINAHMHTWQTALRGMASNWTLPEYFRWMHAGLGTQFAPDDIRIGTYAGAMNQLNAGTTTLVDWCHNNPTPAHTDAAIDALAQSGIRAAFFHGSPKPDPEPGQQPYWEVSHPRHEIERLQADPRFAVGGLLSLGMAILGPHYSTLKVARADFVLARERGLVVSMHQGGGAPHAADGWTMLDRDGLLGPHVNIVHGNDLSDAQLDRFAALGMSFSLTPEGEMTQGHGHPITGRLRKRGIAPSIGVDLESNFSGEMLIAARIALAHQRALDNADFRRSASAEGPGIPPTTTVPALEALRWVTVAGAQMLGKADRIGSITPGKQADLVLIDARQPNMQPVHDPISAVLMHTSLSNIDSVMVAGRWRKRHGVLVDAVGSAIDPESWLPALRESGHRLAFSVGWQAPQLLGRNDKKFNNWRRNDIH
jgi:cytosine/adenosine deaminase-related metal-dependent hydrolase